MLRVIAEVALFVLFAWVMRRLLGVQRLSLTKTVVAALIGLALGETIGLLLARRGLASDLAVTTGIVLGLVFAMMVTLTLEALASQKRRRPIWRRNPAAFLRRRIGQSRRSIEIAGIASRHGLGRGLGLALGSEMTADDAAAYGADLRAALEDAGGVFVKLGQVLATRTDLIPESTAAELGALHQDVEPVPRDELEPAIEAALGRQVDEVFAEFEWSPLGAASIGQVHSARLRSGTRVVVKARRPDVSDTIDRDLEIALDLARVLHERSPQAARLGIVGVTEQFAAQLRAELDYAIEAANTREAAAALSSDAPIVVPTVIDEHSSDALLVMTYVDGTPLGRVGVVDRERGRRLADALFRVEIDAMLTGRRFHADPHPGNVLLTPDGQLGLIDFGSAGRLDAFERSSVSDILTALALNDATMLRAAALQMGMEPPEIDPSVLDRAFARLMAEHLGPGAAPTAELLQDFLAVATRFGLAMPPSMSQMLRALVTLQGTLDVLDPEFAIVDAAKSIASEEIRRDLRPDNLTDQAKREAIRVAPLLRRVPHHLDRIAGQIESGRVTVRLRLFSDDDDLRVISRLVNRIVLVAVGSALGVVSALLFGLTTGPTLSPNVRLFDLLGFIGLFAGAVLIMRVVLEILREP